MGRGERQKQHLVRALVAQRGKASKQQAQRRLGEALQARGVGGKHGVDLAAGDDGADESGGPHAVHTQQPCAVEARGQAESLPENAQSFLRAREFINN